MPVTSVVKNLEDLAQEKSRVDPKSDLKTNALATSGMTPNNRMSQLPSQDIVKADAPSAEPETDADTAPAPTLEIIERTRYGRDRAGILFSNVLS